MNESSSNGGIQVPRGNLYTIGYEGAHIGDFIATLKVAGVESIVDIREVPVSRKPGFSKKALASRAEEAGFAYIHLRGLGDLKEGRDAARMGHYDKFRAIFHEHLRSDQAREELAVAIRVAIDSASCLLCFERDPKHYHRTIVAAEILKRSSLELRHLGVREGLAESKQEEFDRHGIGVHAVG